MKLSSLAITAALGTAFMLTACNQERSPHGLKETSPPDSGSMDPIASGELDSQPTTGTPASENNEIESIKAFLGPNQTLLAHKKMILPDGKHPYHAIVLRHINQSRINDPSWNPCELMIIREIPDSYEITGSTTKAVDCTNIPFSGEIATSPDDLNDCLVVDNSSGRVTYSNEYTRSISTYSFEYSKEMSEWHLSGARNSYPMYDPASDEMQAVVEEIKYPEDFGWISMHDFDPADLLDIFVKNRVVF